MPTLTATTFRNCLRVGLFSLAFPLPVHANQSHCTDREQTVFSCSIAKSAKIVSLCASGNLTKNDGNLVYRFGPPGKIELEFPSPATNSLQQFRYAHYSRYQTDRTEVSFTIGQFDYSVFDYYDEQAKPKYARGVSVSNVSGNGRDIQIFCGGKVTSELKKLDGIVPCDTDNALASCN